MLFRDLNDWVLILKSLLHKEFYSKVNFFFSAFQNINLKSDLLKAAWPLIQWLYYLPEMILPQSTVYDLQSGSFSHLRWKRGKGEQHIWDGAALDLAFTCIKSMWKVQPITREEMKRGQKRPMNVLWLTHQQLTPNTPRLTDKSCVKIMSLVYFLCVSCTPIY